ncbi:hypothetical protein ACHAPX_007457 [Trichoderma viride]
MTKRLETKIDMLIACSNAEGNLSDRVGTLVAHLDNRDKALHKTLKDNDTLLTDVRQTMTKTDGVILNFVEKLDCNCKKDDDFEGFPDTPEQTK